VTEQPTIAASDLAPTTPQVVLTINARGEVRGDTSHIPPETLEKLQTPEAREQMRGM
jgi:hypothetical protein